MVAGTTEDELPEIKLNDLQESYPSEATDEIVAKCRKQKPIIERSAMPTEISLPRGENLNLKVKVQGEPITDKAWFWGRREIKNSTP